MPLPRTFVGFSSTEIGHEGGSLQLHFKPGGLHSGERLDGGSLWDPPGVFRRDRYVHCRIDPVRDL